MQALEEELTAKQKEDAKTHSTLTAKKDAIKAENKKLNQLKKQHTNVCIWPNCIHNVMVISHWLETSLS